jgi:hypothetical protein
MRPSAIVPAWWRILRGYRPFLSVEVTRRCPLRCPGCYAFSPEHIARDSSPDVRREPPGGAFVEGVIALVRQSRPLHVSLVGGEPLLRFRELGLLIARLDAMGIEIQLVTSGFRPIPADWRRFRRLHLVVSIDGLPPEHDARRAPATFERILRHIDGHQVIAHCTITPPLLEPPGYLDEFVALLSSQPAIRKIWFSLYTPQVGEQSSERLSSADRTVAIERIGDLGARYPKLEAPPSIVQALRTPPGSPDRCIFSQVTACLASDLATPVVPCQIGGRPLCTECGCMAAAGFSAIGNVRLGRVLKLSDVFASSRRLGERTRGRELRSPSPR